MAKTKNSKYQDQSGHAVRTQRTRERVLGQALELFNTDGEANITTGHIAEALNMSPGNLYYHFRNKDDIIQALFERFEHDIDVTPPPAQTATAAPSGASMEHLWMYMHIMFDCIWEYRFLYRNLSDLLNRNHKLADAFAKLVATKRDTVRALCHGLVASKSMQATPLEINTLSENVLIVATYWLPFKAGIYSKQAQAPGHMDRELGRGVFQVMSLVSPHLIGDARVQLQVLAAQYVPES